MFSQKMRAVQNCMAILSMTHILKNFHIPGSGPQATTVKLQHGTRFSYVPSASNICMQCEGWIIFLKQEDVLSLQTTPQWLPLTCQIKLRLISVPFSGVPDLAVICCLTNPCVVPHPLSTSNFCFLIIIRVLLSCTLLFALSFACPVFLLFTLPVKSSRSKPHLALPCKSAYVASHRPTPCACGKYFLFPCTSILVYSAYKFCSDESLFFKSLFRSIFIVP